MSERHDEGTPRRIEGLAAPASDADYARQVRYAAAARAYLRDYEREQRKHTQDAKRAARYRLRRRGQ